MYAALSMALLPHASCMIASHRTMDSLCTHAPNTSSSTRSAHVADCKVAHDAMVARTAASMNSQAASLRLSSLGWHPLIVWLRDAPAAAVMPSASKLNDRRGLLPAANGL